MASFDNRNTLNTGFQRKKSTATLQRRVPDSPALLRVAHFSTMASIYDAFYMPKFLVAIDKMTLISPMVINTNLRLWTWAVQERLLVHHYRLSILNLFLSFQLLSPLNSIRFLVHSQRSRASLWLDSEDTVHSLKSVCARNGDGNRKRPV